MDSKRTIDKLHLTFDRGVSLVEILVGLSVFGFVTILIASLYFTHFKLFSNQNTLVDLSSQNKLVLDDITNQVRESQGVATSCCGGDTTSATVLVLQLWPLDAAGEPFQPAGNAYDFVVYQRDSSDNTKLLKKTAPDATSTRVAKTSILSSTVANLAFTYDNVDPTLASEITIDVTNTQTTYGKTHTISQSASAVLRNK